MAIVGQQACGMTTGQWFGRNVSSDVYSIIPPMPLIYVCYSPIESYGFCCDFKAQNLRLKHIFSPFFEISWKILDKIRYFLDNPKYEVFKARYFAPPQTDSQKR